MLSKSRVDDHQLRQKVLLVPFMIFFLLSFFAQLQCVSSTGSDSAMCSEKPQHERSPYLQGAPSIQNSDNLDTIKIKIMHHAH